MNRKGKRRKEVNSHISLQTIKEYLLHGKYPSGCSPIDKRGIRKRSESFNLEGDDLYYIARPKRLDDEPVVPDPRADKSNFRKAVLTVREQLAVTARAHVSETGVHKGTERTLHGVSSQYYWVGMSATARQVVKNCVFCLTRQDTISTEVSTASNDIQPSDEHAEGQSESIVKEESNLTVDGESVMSKVTDLPFTVTSEVDHPVEEDPDLNFDVGAILCGGKNLIEESEIIKAQRFWERVEILIFSPTTVNKKKEDGRGRHKNYTIVAVDSFSKWPEAKKLDKINEQTISQFIIQLISRFGIMDQLVILENDVLIEQSMIITGITQNLSMFNVVVLSESHNPYDENWSRICKCVSKFVECHPSNWSSCLDICLMPLRNSIAPHTDYSPAFVVTRREPVFPSFLFPHRDLTGSGETLLNEEQIASAAESLMSKYQECCEADVKQIITPFDTSPPNSRIPNTYLKDEASGVRRSGRKVTVSHRLTDYEHAAPLTEQTEENMDVDSADVDHPYDEETGEDGDLSVPLKKRKYADFANDLPEAPIRNTFEARTNFPNNRAYDGEDFLNKLDSCTFYQVLKLYIEKSQYPLNSPVTFKRVVRKAREMYSLEDGKLMYNHKNKTKKLVLTTMKERLNILDEVHTSSDDHVPRSRMLDMIEQRQVHWKSLGGDVDAFVKACPNCKHGKPRPRMKKKTGKKWQEDQDSDDEDDWCVGEKYQGTISSFFPDLFEFLNSGAGPSHLSRSELVLFKKKAKSFKIVKGELYYCPPSTPSKSKGRKVLVNEDQRRDVMQKAHGASHKSPSTMLAEIKKVYCWRPIRKDIENYVENCCQSETEIHKDRIDNELSQKVEIFERHFRGEDICTEPTDLDSLFPDTSIDLGESLDDRTGQLTRNTDEKGETLSEDSIKHPIIARVLGSPFDQETDSALTTSHDQKSTIAVNSTLHEASVSKSIVEQASQIAEIVNDQIPEFRVELSVDEVYKEGEKEEEEGREGESEKGDLLQFVKSLKAKKPGVKMRCEICKKIIRGENNFKEHMYKHDGIKPFSCEVCNKKLTTIKGMRMHMRKHTGHRPFLCSICGRGFPRSASLRYHIKTHDKAAALPVTCDICNRQFSSEHRLAKHKRFKHPEKRPVWKCDACGKHFTAKRSLKRHEEAHQGIRRYECEFCKRSFFRKEYLTYHLESHYKGNPSMAHLSSKRKRRIAQRQTSGKEENTNILSIYTVDPDMGQDKMYTQLVEVTNSHGWTEGGTEGPTVFTLDGGALQVGEGGTIQVREVVSQTDPGTTLVMVEEGVATTSTGANHGQELEIGHIIVSSNVNPQEQQTTTQPTQLHLPIPPNQTSVQQTHNELTFKTTTEAAAAAVSSATPGIIESVSIVDNSGNNHQHQLQTHNNNNIQVQEVVSLSQQGDHSHIKQEIEVEAHQQEPGQLGTILTTIASPGTSSTDGSIVLPSDGGSRHIEVRMSNGQKLTLSRTDEGVIGGDGGDQKEEIVQYRVECLDGETITEEHLNAFRMLSQATSLLQP